VTADRPPLSVLDLSPVPSGTAPSQALHETLALARSAEAAGYHRYWLAEHHNIRSVVSTSPDVMIAAVAAATSTIRVGSGGVMLPNHSPLKVAETFRVLAGLHPGRIDLGIGRAPGTDQRTALALRRSREALTADDFPDQYAELRAYAEGFPPVTRSRPSRPSRTTYRCRRCGSWGPARTAVRRPRRWAPASPMPGTSAASTRPA
jgi:luciferase family oxidoreductase group 1